ncbi:MAG: hypothetical protein ACLQD8_09095 [Thermoplasmata archaeon]
MVADTDADDIQRDRERRQAAERRRIDGERERRRAELVRLRAFESGRPQPDAARPMVAGRRETPRPVPPEGTDRLVSKPIGAPIRSDAVREFLAVDPAEGFDLPALNVVPLSGLVGEVADDPQLLGEVSRRVRALLARVKQEVDDPLSAGAFLREQVLAWYRQSAGDPAWSGRMALRWAGIFADSRVSGGRLHPWLNRRLWSVREEATDAGRLPGKIRRGFLRDRRAEQTISRTPSQQIQAEVAQALLDDLGTRARDPEVPLPLVRLSELAVRRQVTTVNDSLGLLFSSPESGPFVLLHPNRYPDCEELVIRPPTPGAAGAALAYSLAPGRPSRRNPVRLNLSADGVEVAGAAGGAAPGASDPEGEIDAATIWESDPVGPRTWLRVVEERRRERRRLDPPPKDFRSRAAFPALKELILEHAEFRKALLAAKWRGRPSGLPLLVALLQKGRLVPEVSTDHEYLEAELAEWAQEGSSGPPVEGAWSLAGWTVRREGAPGSALAYRAERTAGRGGART